MRKENLTREYFIRSLARWIRKYYDVYWLAVQTDIICVFLEKSSKRIAMIREEIHEHILSWYDTFIIGLKKTLMGFKYELADYAPFEIFIDRWS